MFLCELLGLVQPHRDTASELEMKNDEPQRQRKVSNAKFFVQVIK